MSGQSKPNGNFQDTVPAFNSATSQTSVEQNDDIRLSRIEHTQAKLADGLDRIAEHIAPLLTKQFDDTQQRVRILERRILARQERPVIYQLVEALANSERLQDSAEARTFLVEQIEELLAALGYQRFGELGDAYDAARHEVVAAEQGAALVVRKIHKLGLESFGDVLIPARVEIGPPEKTTPETDVRLSNHDPDEARS
jgi:molecular chaperone GrpE (heat shock protein)